MKKVAYFFSGFLPIITAIGAMVLAFAFMVGISVIFLSASGRPTDWEDLLGNTDFNTCVMLLYTFICIVLMGLWYYSRCGGDFLPKPSRTFHVMELLGIAALVPGMQFFSTYLAGIVGTLVPKWMEQYEKLVENAGLDSDISPLMLLYAVILGPVCEELIFRGATMSQAKQALPFWLANLFQAALFGIFHMNWIQGIYAFALGIVLGYIYEKGGSIYHSILFHILFNFWGTVLGRLLDIPENKAVLIGILMFVSMLVSLTVGGLLFIFGTKKKEQKLQAVTSFSAVHE